MNGPFLLALILALLSEIADKTQLVILGLALRYKSPFKVFSGALCAHAIMDGLAIVAGTFFGFSWSSALIKNAVGVVFILLGLWGFSKLYLKSKRENKGKKDKKEKKEFGSSKNAFLASFLLVLASEFGDKTQITSGLLAAKYQVPVSIFLGFVVALAVAIGFNVLVGSKIAQKLPRRTIKIITAILFVIFGIYTLLQ